MVSQYQRGRAKEYKAMIMLRKEGWLVARSAASHGPVDLFAAKGGKVMVIQVKSGKATVKKDELKQLVRWAENFNAEGQVWYFKGRGNTQKRRVFSPNQG